MSNQDKPVSEAMDKAIKRLALQALFQDDYSCILVYKEYANAEDVFTKPLFVKVSDEEITSGSLFRKEGS